MRQTRWMEYAYPGKSRAVNPPMYAVVVVVTAVKRSHTGNTDITLVNKITQDTRFIKRNAAVKW